ncbi:MAG: NDP-hexose 2,3-dehydratase family protein [Bacteroidales bacterium]|nr:NDP-hexose 2,3-dehydratase family protein [Bacteroidales bacterium]
MIRSLTTHTNPFNTTEELIAWVERRNREVTVQVDEVPFAALAHWYQDADGCLRHESGKFFSIEGMHVSTDYGHVPAWDQPIINQPEIGYLGILAKEMDGVLYFLMQAKIEPGNVNCVQISPTLQATKSNYTRVHQGRKPAYLDYFLHVRPENILLDQLQSEQGARFLRKRNRNIIIRVDEEIEVLPDFRWFTLAQIQTLIHRDNMVNMDTRTVLSGIDYGRYCQAREIPAGVSDWGRELLASSCYRDIRSQLSWLSGLKSRYDLSVSYKPIRALAGWQLTDSEIVREDREFFRVLGVQVTISNREVSAWCQPIVQPMQQGLCAFIVKRRNGILHFLVQAKMECGTLDVLELAPSVQCLTGRLAEDDNKPAFVDYVLGAPERSIRYDVLQSEEGGRFYHEQNRNMIVEAGADFPDQLPDRYCWMTLGQLYEFLKFNNFLNIQARSLLAALSYI